MANDSVGRTFGVALGVCLVCSVLVSAAAVSLRPTQAVNKALDKKRNILMAAGLLKSRRGRQRRARRELYQNINPRVVDLATGEYIDGVDPVAYDSGRRPRIQRRARWYRRCGYRQRQAPRASCLGVLGFAEGQDQKGHPARPRVRAVVQRSMDLWP